VGHRCVYLFGTRLDDTSAAVTRLCTCISFTCTYQTTKTGLTCCCCSCWCCCVWHGSTFQDRIEEFVEK